MANRKIVTAYDGAGYYTGPEYADESPLEPGVYHLPANSTDKPLPFCKDGEWPRWNGTDWERVPMREVPHFTEHARKQRDTLLSQTDWAVLPDSPLKSWEVRAYKVYRQALRDLTNHPQWPAMAFPELKLQKPTLWQILIGLIRKP